MNNPCICSSEHRKEVREAHKVNSCKTVCEKWKEYEQFENARKDKIRKERQLLKSADYYKRDAVERNKKSRKSRKNAK